MRIIFLFIVAMLITTAGCNDSPEPPEIERTSSGSKSTGLLPNIDLSHPTPDELGGGWVYSTGRRHPSAHGRYVNEGYENKKLGAYIKLVISRFQSVSDAVKSFEMQISGFKSSPYSGLGDEARVEPRGSRRRPYVIVCFRRANMLVVLHKDGSNHEIALNVAQVIDHKIKSNLE